MNLRLIALIATTFTGVLTFADSVSAKNVAVCDIQRTTEQQLAQDASSPDRGLRPEPIQKAPAKKVIPSNVPPRPTNNADDFETVLWNIVKASQDPADYESYLEIYPRGRFAKEARERLKRIKADTRAAPAPRTPPTQKRNAAGPEPVLVELNLQLTRNERVLIQRSLNAKGFDAGGADGLFGQKTRSAIRNFQSKTGFSKTGYLTATQAKLLIADGRRISVPKPPTRAEATATPKITPKAEIRVQEKPPGAETQSSRLGSKNNMPRPAQATPDRGASNAVSALPEPGKEAAIDHEAIKRTIEKYLFLSAATENCWGDINVVPSTECYLDEIKQIKFEKKVGDRVTVLGRYTISSWLETRSFTNIFELVHDGYKYRIVSVRPK